MHSGIVIDYCNETLFNWFITAMLLNLNIPSESSFTQMIFIHIKDEYQV